MKIKKIISLILAGAALLSFAACSGGKDNNETLTVPEKTYAWPDNALFGDVPALSDKVNSYIPNKNDKGSTYEFGAASMSYAEFRSYILSLEKAGFSVYDVAGLGTASTASMLPEKLENGKVSASWVGSRRGLFVAANWYADEYFEKNDIDKENNVVLTFYTYNPFK